MKKEIPHQIHQSNMAGREGREGGKEGGKKGREEGE